MRTAMCVGVVALVGAAWGGTAQGAGWIDGGHVARRAHVHAGGIIPVSGMVAFSYAEAVTSSDTWKEVIFRFQSPLDADLDYLMLGTPTPLVIVGNTSGGPARAGVSWELLGEAGSPDKMVRFSFANGSSFEPGETLWFGFSYQGRAGQPALIDPIFVRVPAPGAAMVMACGAGLLGIRRRR